MDSSAIRQTILPCLLAILLPALRGVAQTGCANFGSTPVAASIQPSPILLGCTAAPTWPAWHLFTPGHRAPGRHTGFDPGTAFPLPRVLVAYRCTGLLLLPVVPTQIRTMGYVIDQPEIACALPTS